MKKLTILKISIVLFLVPFTSYIVYKVISYRKTPLPINHPGNAAEKEVTRLERFEMKGLRDDRESFNLNAEKFFQLEKGLLRLEGINSLVIHSKDGKKIATSADRGIMLEPEGKERRIAVEGHVRLATEDGTEIETESLFFEEKEEKVRADKEVRIRRENIHAISSSMTYDLNREEAILSPNFHLEIPSKKNKIIAQAYSFRGDLALGEGLLEGGVRISDPMTTVTATEARIHSERDAKQMKSIVLFGNVLGEMGFERGGRRSFGSLQADSMEIFFHDSIVKRIICKDRVSLQLRDTSTFPTEQEPMTIKADFTEIKKDEQGTTHLEFKGSVMAEVKRHEDERAKGSSVVEDLSCGLLRVTIGGDDTVERGHAEEKVLYRRGDLRAEAEEVDYVKNDSRVVMMESRGRLPRMIMEDWSVQASEIEIVNDSTLKASGKVKSRYEGVRGTEERLYLFDDEKAVFIASNTLFLQKDEVVHHSGNAMAWQEDNSINADDIFIHLKERKFEARGKVISRFGKLTALADEKESKDSAPKKLSRPAIVQSDSLIYLQDQKKAAYQGNVTLKCTGRELSCQEMDIYFDESGNVERIIAILKVQLKGDGFRATGGKIDYAVASRLATISGNAEPARIYNHQEKEIAVSASLTFDMAEDKISLLSKEGGRTWITLK
ncbi:MAG: LPS export ABC transporter periplasmic protein LptC [Acidobacteriota bacterium]